MTWLIKCMNEKLQWHMPTVIRRIRGQAGARSWCSGFSSLIFLTFPHTDQNLEISTVLEFFSGALECHTTQQASRSHPKVTKPDCPQMWCQTQSLISVFFLWRKGTQGTTHLALHPTWLIHKTGNSDLGQRLSAAWRMKTHFRAGSSLE